MSGRSRALRRHPDLRERPGCVLVMFLLLFGGPSLGFLGWSAWLFPVSHIATGVGLLLFGVNILFAFAMFGLGAFRIDWTTGVIETAGGLPTLLIPITGFTGGFSLGNFTFLTALPTPGDFLVPSLSSHETGHTLNTAAFAKAVRPV